MKEETWHWTQISLLVIILLSLVVSLGFPLLNLLHPSPWQRSIGLLHSLSAMLSLWVMLSLGALTVPLLQQHSSSIRLTQWGTLAAVLLSLLNLASGLWAFARYNAPVASAAKNYLRATTPLAHSLLMNWHQYSSLFLIGLSIVSFYCCYTYGDRLLAGESAYTALRLTVIQSFLLMLCFTLSNWVVGIGVTKIHAL